MNATLQNSHIAGQLIGDWIANKTIEGTVIWTKKKRLLKKESMLAVYATPHYDHPNVVAVDVVNLSAKDDCSILSTRFKLKGESIASDLAMYLYRVNEILSILK